MDNLNKEFCNSGGLGDGMLSVVQLFLPDIDDEVTVGGSMCEKPVHTNT